MSLLYSRFYIYGYGGNSSRSSSNPGCTTLIMRTLRADIGVMITASHNTYNYNGLKFFNSDGFKISTKQEKQIEDIVLNKK